MSEHPLSTVPGIVNLMPKEVVVHLAGGNRVVIPGSGNYSWTKLDFGRRPEEVMANGISIVRDPGPTTESVMSAAHHIVEASKAFDDAVVLVSSKVAEALVQHAPSSDLCIAALAVAVSPDTGPTAWRNGKGAVVGVRRLIRRTLPGSV